MIVCPDAWLSLLSKKHPADQRHKINLTIHGCLVGASFVFGIIRAYGFLSVCLRCSELLHDKMVWAVLQAPVLFFDSNPVGRIMNRFSKDIGCLDEVLPKPFLRSIQFILVLFAGILVPTVTNPWLLVVVVPLAILVVFMSRYYLKTSRELIIGVHMPQSRLLSYFGNPGWTGNDSDKRKTKIFCGSLLQVQNLTFRIQTLRPTRKHSILEQSNQTSISF